MRNLVFDTSSIITITTNNLLWALPLLKERFKGEFIISKSIKQELIDVPINSRKFELEAVILAASLAKNDLTFYNNSANLDKKTSYLLDLANNIFSVNGNPIKIVDRAEIEGLALTCILKSSAYVVDERTIRLLIEDYNSLADLLARKLNARVDMNKANIAKFSREICNIPIIRSAELMVVAFELGFFDKYKIGDRFYKGGLNPHLLDGLLWGLRLRGCAISTQEIEDILKLEKFK